MAACGTRSGYVGGCRCDPCRKAHTIAQTEWRHAGSAARPPRYPTLPPTGDWVDQAACVGHDPERWYLPGRGSGTYDYARAICAICPVKADCLDWALRAGEDQGMWGGLAPWQRRQLGRVVP